MVAWLLELPSHIEVTILNPASFAAPITSLIVNSNWPAIVCLMQKQKFKMKSDLEQIKKKKKKKRLGFYFRCEENATWTQGHGLQISLCKRFPSPRRQLFCQVLYRKRVQSREVIRPLLKSSLYPYHSNLFCGLFQSLPYVIIKFSIQLNFLQDCLQRCSTWKARKCA